MSTNNLQLWLENKTTIQSVQSASDAQYNDVVSICERTYNKINEEIKTTIDNEYVYFLTSYANICAMKEESILKEIELQEAIITIRRNQVNTDKTKYAQKLSNSLYYASDLYRRSNNATQAIERLKEKLKCEYEILENEPQAGVYAIGITQYLLANTYALCDQTTLAEEYYKECIETFDTSAKQEDCNITTIFAQILTEFAELYLSVGNINNAIDRYLQAIDLYMSIETPDNKTKDLLLALLGRLKEIYTITHNNQKAEYYNQLIEIYKNN